MAKTRASIFDTDADEVDLSGFRPKTAPTPDALPADQVREISEASNFPSREARPRKSAAAKPAASTPPTPRREARRLRTGRTAQLNARASQQTVEDFYAIADRQGWKAAETLERAVAALKRELAGQGGE